MIIDNGSSDDTQLIIKRFVATFSGAVQLVSEPKRGLANAHNAGFRKARSPICVFIDDDCYPSDDYLDAMSLCFAEDPGIGFIGGRILPWTDDDCKVAIQKSIKRVSFSPSSFIPTGVIHGPTLHAGEPRLRLQEALTRDSDRALLSSTLKKSNSSRGYPTSVGLALMIQGPWSITITVGKNGWDEWRIVRSYERGRGGYYAKCLLNRTMRAIYLSNWWRGLRKQSWNTSVVEFVSGIEFILREMLAGIVRIIVPGRQNQS